MVLLALCLFIAFSISFNKAASALNPSIKTSAAVEPNSKVVFYASKNGQISSNGLSQANYIFEYIHPNGSLYYQAIFEKEVPNSIGTMENFNSALLIPNFNYKTNNNISLNPAKSASSIFVTFDSLIPSSNSQIPSNFMYSNGKYYHYKNKTRDVDGTNNTPISVHNVIVQFVNSPIRDNNLNNITGEGTGFLFSDGKGLEIKWHKAESNPIKITDSNNNPVFLTKGSVWWIIIDKESSVVFN